MSLLDELIVRADDALRGFFPPSTPVSRRPSPAEEVDEGPLDAAQRRHSAGLMRVNHAGEVCAQALYKGQALGARTQAAQSQLLQAAEEEAEHLKWCQERIEQLGGKSSYLNPLWSGMSFSIGALVTLAGDRISMGFVAATEEEVCRHLEHHLRLLPEQDAKSRAVLMQMLEEEAGHGENAIASGGMDFPVTVKLFMRAVSQVMLRSSYYL